MLIYKFLAIFLSFIENLLTKCHKVVKSGEIFIRFETYIYKHLKRLEFTHWNI